MALYDLRAALDRERFKTRSNHLYKRGATVELTEKRERRSLSQNNYLHLILTGFAMEYGESVEYVKQVLFKCHCNADIFIKQVSDMYAGEREYIRSSADLDTAEMTLAIDRFRDWANKEAGIYLPSPNEEEMLKSLEIEASKYDNKRWL